MQLQKSSLTLNKPCHQINSIASISIHSAHNNEKKQTIKQSRITENMTTTTTITSSIPYIKIPSSSSAKPSIVTLTIRSSQTDGPLRRPVASSPSPPLRPPLKPNTPPLPQKLITPVSTSSTGMGSGGNGITFEFQRQMAKELQDYFKKKKLEEANQGPFFGFLPKNEISNGRWAMFGFSVGLLTEYATGSDFVDQLKILLSNFGILDLE